MTTIGESGGIGYEPAVCGDQKWRSSVVRSGWWSDLTSGEVIHWMASAII
jgi:hypothetical protein